jgi:hypothetical protein
LAILNKIVAPDSFSPVPMAEIGRRLAALKPDRIWLVVRGAGMGYCHYWEIEQEIDQESFLRIIADVQQIVLVLDDMGVRLAGPLGRGLPEIEADHIAFNGLWECGHIKNEEIVIPFPSEEAAGIGSSINAVAGSYYGMGTLLKHRTCDGNCSYETFRFVPTCNESETVRDVRYCDSCKTGFRPYDLAVQCVLLIAKHHLKDRIQVWSGGSDYHWNDARLLCYVHLSYPLSQYRVDRDAGLILT